MELPPKVASAMNAMKDLGFSWEITKPILKDLLRAYDHNWCHIEAENYRVLADAVLDYLEGGLKKKERHNEGVVDKKNDIYKNDAEKIPPNSACVLYAQIGEPSIRDAGLPFTDKNRMIISAHHSSALKTNGLDLIQESSGNTKPQNLSPVKCFVEGTSSRTVRKDKRPVHQVLDTSVFYKRTNNESKRRLSTVIIKRAESKVPLQKEPISSSCLPGQLSARTVGHQELPSHSNLSKGSCSSRQLVSAQNVEKRKLKETSLNENIKNTSTVDCSVRSSSSINIELASSTSGEMRLVILCDPAQSFQNFQMPTREVLCKMVDDRCLKSFKILEPHFSLLSLLKEMCNCVVELGFKYSKEKGNDDMIRQSNAAFSSEQQNHMNRKNINDTRSPGTEVNKPLSMVLFQKSQLSSSSMRTDAACDTDICRGEENVKVSLSNVPNAEKYPSSFQYIPRNIVYQDAYVNISLARIGDEDSCSTCYGDCLAASIPCHCARETGGDYAYTSGGLMKKQFLDAIMSMKYDQLKKNLYFCKDCPIERFRNEMMPEPCKGHLIRKFVKECWSKCRCNRVCGNRLVQRGITCSLQVFWTAEGKGWGLRTLEELPRGAFVCEYVGEILTNTELYERQLQVTGKMKHTYPVLLDADWGSEQVLKDEEALCLDATFYGNVARFINHRCADANVVEVPVEVETPDHHYYHLAFFTVREVDALEELTWDYGIDFADHTHPIKAFSCHCGSKLCRDRPQIRKRSALVFG